MKIQELRDWSVKLMGAEIHSLFGNILCWPDGRETAREDWRPDDPTTGQIWMVVAKMQSKNHFLQFEDEGLKTGEFSANYGFQAVLSTNPCLAILAAAKATGEGED